MPSIADRPSSVGSISSHGAAPLASFARSLVLIMATPLVSGAQATTVRTVPPVPAAAQIRVTTDSIAQPRAGTFGGWRGDTLLFMQARHDTVAIAIHQLRRLELRAGQESHWIAGLVFGTVSGGLILSPLLNGGIGPSNPKHKGAITGSHGYGIGMLIGAAVGTAIGRAIHTPRWQLIGITRSLSSEAP